jgi:hypothetical protein
MNCGLFWQKFIGPLPVPRPFFGIRLRAGKQISDKRVIFWYVYYVGKRHVSNRHSQVIKEGKW